MITKCLWASAALLAVQASIAAAAEVPISRVVLYSSGVGFFEREGTVTGDASVELSFRTAQVNDILKSLVLQDLSGGTVAPVTYAPQDPLERTLSSFAVDISDNPTLAKLWDRLRGARVAVTADKIYEGIAFGAERQEKSVGDHVVTFDVLNLLTDAGFVEVPLWQAKSVKLLDARLDSDVRKALAAIDQSRDADKRPVTLSFKGEGDRTVRVGYLLETPVWKTSYRLLADAEGLFLQGWAIVENTTDDDWTNVQLSMVSGRPISFIQNLYEPLYVKRPTVAVSVQQAAAPQVWEGAMGEEAEAPEMMADMALGARPSVARAAKPGMMMGGMGGGMAMAAPAAPAPTMNFAGAGVGSMAEGGKVGTLFRYAINQPVTVARKRSAMIPIINNQIDGEKLSVYDASVDAKHPMNGIKLKNSTGLSLMGGPITVFADSVYGGDALVEDVAPGDERLITYAMDLALEVSPETRAAPEQLLGVKVVNGVMTLSRKQRSEMTYTVKSVADAATTLLIEHPIRPEWTLVEPAEPAEKTRNSYRFRMTVPAGKTEKLTVVEENVYQQAMGLADIGVDSLLYIVQGSKLTPQLRAAAERLAQLRAEEAALNDQIAQRDGRLKEIEQEQDRIRKNMRELDRTSELYKQYVSKLTAQETEFDRLRTESADLRAKLTAKQNETSTYLQSINIE
jgi:hypothetical protein